MLTGGSFKYGTANLCRLWADHRDLSIEHSLDIWAEGPSQAV